MKPTSEKIYQTALSLLGQDASPNDEAPDELGCANTVSSILQKAGCPIPMIISTASLDQYFHTNTGWEKVTVPQRGNILVSPTGQGGLNGISHGHTGIIGDNGTIMSNDSATGQFRTNYTLTSWKHRYADTGGYPMNFYALRADRPPTEAEKIQVASEAIRVATIALKTPSLRERASALLKAALELFNIK